MALEVGTLLAPKRKREGARLSKAQYQHLSDNLHNPDLVYFTTDRELARAWCVRSKGALLRVEPVGPIEPDPDFPGTSFSAAQAVVIDVAEQPVTMSQLSARKAFAAYQPESFDEKGFIRPAQRLADIFAAAGRTSAAFRKAGRYPNPQRFALRGPGLMYVTDDLELIVTMKLITEYGGVPEHVFQQCLHEARTSWPPMKPIPWV
ncbi:hypothetical protein [Mycolicibacterium fortuitum]|uniref:hypothetical protein n=1 Tax=Mycolicibacterium fortuitum TaxID=1766 RepID=UPI001041E8A2|nr:hypothetical protein [Mycolicibacterium fortuitum]